MTDILFVHNNFPGQYRLLASRLAGSGEFRVAAIGSATATEVPGVLLQRYQSPDASADDIHCFARRFEGECRRTEQVFYAASALKATGIRPKLIFAHPGWGETLALKHAFPDAKMCLYAEFYYRTEGADVGFDTEFPNFGADGRLRISLRNAATLLSLVDSHMAVAPTHWQKSSLSSGIPSEDRGDPRWG